MIRIVIAGPRGKMGQEAVKLVHNTDNFQLAGAIDYKYEGKSLSEFFPMIEKEAFIYTDAAKCFEETKPDCLIDLSVADAAYDHAKAAMEYGIRTVIGTTGLSDEQLDELKEMANEKKTGCIVAPNFALGAVLMMKFSQLAAKYFPDVEIIEMHHDQKKDAPSGTAIKTAQMIETSRNAKKQGHPEEKENLDGARGAEYAGMHIHSIRLPGLIAHQQVMFGSKGETLTIRHDSYNRESFMSGLKMAVNTVIQLDSYVYGMENILE